jgi:hypothetical protein
MFTAITLWVVYKIVDYCVENDIEGRNNIFAIVISVFGLLDALALDIGVIRWVFK